MSVSCYAFFHFYKHSQVFSPGEMTFSGAKIETVSLAVHCLILFPFFSYKTVFYPDLFKSE